MFSDQHWRIEVAIGLESEWFFSSLQNEPFYPFLRKTFEKIRNAVSAYMKCNHLRMVNLAAVCSARGPSPFLQSLVHPEFPLSSFSFLHTGDLGS